tara:strand:+ start:222 stop:1253 length:1032 start_codon:yes stop_codon:yes gene_type:complete
MKKTLEKTKIIKAEQIANLLLDNFIELMSGFYEMQSSFLSDLYSRYESIETANIILCFAKNTHLEIIRQREKYLNHDISLSNFWNNFQSIEKPMHKIVDIVNITGLPKETARRKIKLLIKKNYVLKEKKIKEYYWNLLDLQENKKDYMSLVESEIKILSKFVSNNASYLKINLNQDEIAKEIKNEFSFYWYHFLSCQLKWLHMWQSKIKDIDLILIVLQAVLPALHYADKKGNLSDLGLDNLYLIVGKTNNEYRNSNAGVSATSISQVTGIPRPTCIRKLNMLVNLGTLVRDAKSKRYYLNQTTENRTKNILTKDNVTATVNIFSEYLSIILNAIVQNKKNIA